MRGADDAVALIVVAQTDRDNLGHQRVFLQRLDRRKIDIARRHVQMQHTGQNQLHRAAFGAHDHVNAGQIPVKGALHMVRYQQQKGD